MTGTLLASCSGKMDRDEWTALGQTLASLWCAVGDELIYPIGDAYPDLIKPLRLPKSEKKTRSWGPLRERPSTRQTGARRERRDR